MTRVCTKKWLEHFSSLVLLPNWFHSFWQEHFYVSRAPTRIPIKQDKAVHDSGRVAICRGELLWGVPAPPCINFFGRVCGVSCRWCSHASNPLHHSALTPLHDFARLSMTLHDSAQLAPKAFIYALNNIISCFFLKSCIHFCVGVVFAVLCYHSFLCFLIILLLFF